MSLEWSVAALLLAVALWPLARNTRSLGTRVALLLLVLGLVLGGLVWKSRAQARLNARQQLRQKLPAEQRPGGFVRSDACRSCHPQQYESWHQSYHRTMTQRATPESVRGPFTNVTLTLAGEVFHLSRRGDGFFVEMVDPDWTYVRALARQALSIDSRWWWFASRSPCRTHSAQASWSPHVQMRTGHDQAPDPPAG